MKKIMMLSIIASAIFYNIVTFSMLIPQLTKKPTIRSLLRKHYTKKNANSTNLSEENILERAAEIDDLFNFEPKSKKTNPTDKNYLKKIPCTYQKNHDPSKGNNNEHYYAEYLKMRQDKNSENQNNNKE